MESEISKMILAFLVMGLLILDFTGLASAVTCTDVQTNLQPCLGSMNGLVAAPLPSSCCDGLKVVVNLEKEVGVAGACNCTKGLIMNIPGLDIGVNISTDLQNQCNVDLGFSLANGDSCSSQ